MRAEIIPYIPDPDNTGEGKPELPFYYAVQFCKLTSSSYHKHHKTEEICFQNVF